MSTITVSNIQATGETASRAVSGIAAAWVNFNGTGTIAVRDSMNISSLVDEGSGDYAQTFTSSFNGYDYSATALSSRDNSASQVGLFANTTQPTGNFFRLIELAVSTGYDVAVVMVTFHGDLA